MSHTKNEGGLMDWTEQDQQDWEAQKEQWREIGRKHIPAGYAEVGQLDSVRPTDLTWNIHTERFKNFDAADSFWSKTASSYVLIIRKAEQEPARTGNYGTGNSN